MSLSKLKKINNIIFDFDGTIINSNHIKEDGFINVYKGYSSDIKTKILNFHKSNMGMNRFDKFKFINEKILGKNYSQTAGEIMSEQYFKYIYKKIKSTNLIKGAKDFLSKNYLKYNFFLCSVTLQNDLVKIVTMKGLNKYFIKIKGGPQKKIDAIKEIIFENKLPVDTFLSIGDSYSDLEFSKKLGLSFIGVKSPGSYPFDKNILTIEDFFELEKYL